MAGAAPDVVVFEVPASLDAEQLLIGLEGSIVVPRLRSGDVGTAITIGLEALGGAAGVVQLMIARDELARFSRRLLQLVTKRAGTHSVTLEVKAKGNLKGKQVRIAFRDPHPDERLLNAVLQLVLESEAPTE